MLLKLTGEMLRILKSQLLGRLTDGGSANEKLLSSLHKETTDMGGCRGCQGHADNSRSGPT